MRKQTNAVAINEFHLYLISVAGHSPYETSSWLSLQLVVCPHRVKSQHLLTDQLINEFQGINESTTTP